MQRIENGVVHLLVVIAIATPTAVYAASSADRNADRADLRQLRREIERATAVVDTPRVANTFFVLKQVKNFATAPEQGAKPKPEVTFAIPFTFNSNPEHAESDAKSDGHVDPSIDVSYATPIAAGTLSLEGTADMDLNLDRGSNDSGTLEGVVNLDFDKGNPKLGTPYLNYTIDDLYDGRFGKHSATNHTVSAGLALEHTKDAKIGQPLLLTFNGSVGWRASSKSKNEQFRLKVTGGLKRKIDDRTGWSLTQSFLYKDYQGGTNKGRSDLTAITTAALSTMLPNDVALSFTVQYERTRSDRTGLDYDAWDIGPTLKKSF